MGAFQYSENNIHSCCEKKNSTQDNHNLCKDFSQPHINHESIENNKFKLKKIVLFLIKNEDKFPIYKDFLEKKLNIPPPILNKKIKNYSYITLIWIVKNVN